MSKQQIDRFAVLEPLGAGGQGNVFKAQETLPGGVGRLVALKVLPAIPPNDPEAEKRFIAEVRTFAALSGHPHVVTFHSIGVTAERVPWIAMELLPTNLHKMIGEHPGQAAEVGRMVGQVLSALAFMHGLEPPLLHNDLKPANILLNGFGLYKLTDFGLASLIAMDRTHVLATVRYAAPELLSREFGRVCPATDLYALGHIAYEMALGERAYRQQFPQVFDPKDAAHEAPPAKWMAWHCSLGTAAAPIHEVLKEFPRGLAQIIAKLMAKPLLERYAAAKEVLTDLQAGGVTAAAAGGGGGGAGTGGGSARGPTPPPLPAGQATTAAGAAGAAGAAPGKAIYYVRLRGKVTGPFELATLQRQARQGSLSRLHQVSTDQTTWRGAATVEGLFGGGE